MNERIAALPYELALAAQDMDLRDADRLILQLAADEIHRLRAEVVALKDALRGMDAFDEIKRLQAEIERLRAALLHVLPLAEGEWAHHEQLSNMGTTVGSEALRVIRAALEGK